MIKMLVERILEDFLVENLDLIEPNLKLLERQFYMIGKGKVDLLCRDKNNRIVVIEIKKYASFSSVDQLISYGKDVKEFIKKEDIRLILVCLNKNKDIPLLCKKNNIKFIQIKDKRIPKQGQFNHLSRIHRQIIDHFLSNSSSMITFPYFLSTEFNIPEKKVVKYIEEISKKTTLKFDRVKTLYGTIGYYIKL